jgi:hypothetical protein
MSVPSTVPQLIILVAFILPGVAYQSVRSRLRGPAPDELNATNKVLRAAAVSTGLAFFYAFLIGPELVDLTRGTGWFVNHPWSTALIGLVLLLVVPAALALGGHRWTLWESRPRKFTLSGLTTYDPTPAAWDCAFRDREECFVRVLTSEGRWVGGWFDTDSYASSFPQPRELYIAQQWKMGEDGSFIDEVTNSRGIYVRCDDARVVEFIGRMTPGTDNDVHGGSGLEAAEGEQKASHGREA